MKYMKSVYGCSLEVSEEETLCNVLFLKDCLMRFNAVS